MVYKPSSLTISKASRDWSVNNVFKNHFLLSLVLFGFPQGQKYETPSEIPTHYWSASLAHCYTMKIIQ